MNLQCNLNCKPAAESYLEYAVAPDNYSTIREVEPFLASRIPGFVDFGINGDTLVDALRRVGPQNTPGTSGWAEFFLEYGHQAMKLAEDSEKNSDSRQAERAFLEASFWYFFARFPHIFNESASKAYQLHTKAYLRSLKHSKYPYEVVDITLHDKKGRVFLRLPNTRQAKFPVVIISGGIDIWKSDLEVHSLSEKFLSDGIATLLIDIPGTGETPLYASESADSWYIAALETLKSHPKIVNSRIAFYGLSFGGYWATKLAFVAPWLSGVVNLGGPIHLTFQSEILKNFPQGIKSSLARILNSDPVPQAGEMMDQLQRFSLYRQGHLSTGKHAPILNINGEKDELVPIEEIEFIRKQGVKADTLIFADDRHVASRNWRLHEKFASSWLAKKLIS